MGAEQSSSSRNTRSPQGNFSKTEVNQILERQRLLYEKKFLELMSQNHGSTYTQETARQEARKEVERLLREEKEKQNKQQNVQSSCSGIPATPPRQPTVLERISTPYSFSGEDLKSKALNTSSTSNNNIYPNLNAASSSSFGLTSPQSPFNPEYVRGKLSSVTFTNGTTQNFGADRFQPSAPPAPKERSDSRNRNRNRTAGRNNNEDIEDQELNCPTCKNRYTLTIFQCQRGHSSCVFCKNNSVRCGVCGLPITDMRNITLEAYIGETKIHCPNSKEGCNFLVKLADVDSHKKECPFREMQCPLAAIFGQCQWRGKLPNMAAHFDDVHQMHRQGNVDTEMRLLNVISDNQIVYYVVIGNFNFLFHIKVSQSEGLMYMTVQLLGTQHSASKWNYEIHIYNKAEPRRKFEYSDTCNSINTPINTIFTISKCAVIPLPYVHTFVNNSCVTYKFFIKKETDGRTNATNSGNNNRGRGGARRRC